MVRGTTFVTFISLGLWSSPNVGRRVLPHRNIRPLNDLIQFVRDWRAARGGGEGVRRVDSTNLTPPIVSRFGIRSPRPYLSVLTRCSPPGGWSAGHPRSIVIPVFQFFSLDPASSRGASAYPEIRGFSRPDLPADNFRATGMVGTKLDRGEEKDAIARGVTGPGVSDDRFRAVRAQRFGGTERLFFRSRGSWRIFASRIPLSRSAVSCHRSRWF